MQFSRYIAGIERPARGPRFSGGHPQD